MIYLSSDWHGTPLSKIEELLSKAKFRDSDFMFVLGDVIDRGENSIDLLRWLTLQPNVQLILGNHEAMLLSCAFLFEEVTSESLGRLTGEQMSLMMNWQQNGGESTMKGLAKLDPEEREIIIDYLRDAPLYDSVSLGSGEYLLTHSGLENYREGRSIDDYSEDELLWCRPDPDTRYSDKFITVFGHTPTGLFGREYRGRIFKTDTWWDIDTGAASGLSPMLLRLDDGAEFYLD